LRVSKMRGGSSGPGGLVSTPERYVTAQVTCDSD
jgi:hypothetical protein